MSSEDGRVEELKRAHAAQLDRLLEENARLRQALEGRIDPKLFGAASIRVGPLRRLARKVVPRRFHPTISRAMSRTKR